MMGLLFTLFGAGLIGGGLLLLIPFWRWLAPFALVPVLGAVGAFTSSWGLAVGLERLFDSVQAGGTGFFAGYCFGGLLGAGLGFWLALRFTGRRVSIKPNRLITVHRH